MSSRKVSVDLFSIKKIQPKCGEVSGLLRALAHPGRLLILGHLTSEPKTVTELQSLCGLSQSQLSQFLSRMRAEGLVDYSRTGRFLTYRVSDERISGLIRSIQTIFCK
ncbi:MAG: winged helix-turn-helix transcriptional regulator [Xanthomonadaceae bacterium]|nr:winged helix-turn-helix transcriptional regulator [Xanthomonadaceae bacterium]